MPIPLSRSKKGHLMRYLQAVNDWVSIRQIVTIFGGYKTVKKHLLDFYYKEWIEMDGSTRDRRVRWIKQEEE